MAFPQTSAPTESSFTGGTSHLVNLPATVNDGDLLLLHVSVRQQSGDTITDPSGWTQLYKNHLNQTRAAAYVKIGVSGDSGDTVDIVTNAGHPLAGQVHRITNWFGDLTGVESDTTTASITEFPDPPSLTASWGALSNLWFVFAGGADDDATVDSYPSDFTNGVNTVSGGGLNAGCEVGSAWKEDAVATLNPGTFDYSEGETFVPATIVIRPSTNVIMRRRREMIGFK
jgi:hypothetical protein